MTHTDPVTDSTTTPTATPTARSVDTRPPSHAAQWILGSGLVFAVCFVAGIVLSTGTPDSDAPDQEWVDWFSDSGNRTQQVIGLFLIGIAAVGLVVFISGVVHRTRAAQADRDGASQVALGSGLLLAVTIAIAGVGIDQSSGGIEFGDMPVPGADVLRASESFGFGVLLLAGGFFAALTLASVSLAARGTGALPGWLVTAGFIGAVVLLFSIIFLPMIVLPLWVLVVAVYVGRHPAPAPADVDLTSR